MDELFCSMRVRRERNAKASGEVLGGVTWTRAKDAAFYTRSGEETKIPVNVSQREGEVNQFKRRCQQ